MHRQEISRSSSSDQLSSRVFIQSGEKNNERTLPISITPSSSSSIKKTTTTTTTRSMTHTQMFEGIRSARSVPSFAETQLLSVYYPSQDPKNPPTTDKRIFIDQQDRQPTRLRTAYNPSAPSKSTQTAPLSTHGSTLIIDGKSDPGQFLKIHSGTQHLSDDLPSMPSELIEQSRYSYEEYFVNVNNDPSRTASSSSSSMTTVIAQNGDRDSESSLTANPRTSSWPPVPESLEQEEQRPSRVQFAENLVHVIPVSATNSLTETPISPPPVAPRTTIHDATQSTINQSKGIKTHTDNTDQQTNTRSSHVSAVRSLFEQQSTLNSTSTNAVRTVQSDERPSKHGVEIRLRVNDPHIHHAEPATVISSSTRTPFTLEQIEQITGRRFENFDRIGRYLSDGHTWQWDEVFWLSLTTSQRDQFKELEQRLLSRQNSFENSLSSSSTSNVEAKQFKSTMSVTGTGSRPPNKSSSSSSSSSVLTKYTEVNTINEIQPSVNVFGSSPKTRVNHDESVNHTQRSNSQATINESGYNSSEEQKKRRSNSNEDSNRHHQPPPLPPPPPPPRRQIETLSYEEFILDYLSTHAKPIQTTDGTFLLSIDDQQIPLHNVSIPTSKIVLENIYLDAINYKLQPFETEFDQLIIFLADETLLIPTDRWSFYRKKYQQSTWIRTLKRVHRTIPVEFLPSVEHWISDHAILDLNARRIHLDDINIPVIGRLDRLSHSQGLLNYLIRIGFVSYAAQEKLIRIGNIELDVQRLIKQSSSQFIERLARHLRTVQIDFDQTDQTLIIDRDFLVPHEYVDNLLKQTPQGENLSAEQLATLLCDICQIEEDEEKDILILTFNGQTLRFLNEDHRQFLLQWLKQLNEQRLIVINDQNDIIIYPNHPQRQLFIKREHVNAYMQSKSKSKPSEIIRMEDIAQILILYDYVRYSSRHWQYGNERIELETREFRWLKSIIQSIRTIEHIQQTEIELFDGQHRQTVRVPFQSMSPSNDPQTIAHYLYQNGTIQSDKQTGHYTYRHRLVDRESDVLSSHIRHVHIDETHQIVEIEFFSDPYHWLRIPSDWYEDISKHQFDRSYITEMLMNNGGLIDDDTFHFNDESYALKFSSKQKEQLIDSYVEAVNDQGGIKLDKSRNLILLENAHDGSELYLTDEHTQFIHQNHYRRRDMKYLLNKYGEIKQDEFGNYLLYYQDQCVQLPSRNPSIEQAQISPGKSRQPQPTDSNLKLLFPSNKSLRSIQKTASTTTLDIEPPTEANNYAIDPLLMLANYVHRAGTLYQDQYGRLVIKLQRDEIVVPRHQAAGAIQEINHSPNRTGTIIARLIARIGRVQSNKAGGLIITVGKNSIEVTKEMIEQSKNNFYQSNENLASTSVLPSRSSESLASARSTDTIGKSRSQTSLSIKPHFLIIEDDDHTIRFYVQYTYEDDRRANSVMMLPGRYPVRPTQPRLIAPEHYRDITIRDAIVHVRRQGKNEIRYENLAQYLSTNQTHLSSRTVRRMLKFTTRDEYFAYLHNKMSANIAQQLVDQSEERIEDRPRGFVNIRAHTPDMDDDDRDRARSAGAFYSVKNGRTGYEKHEEYLQRSRSPQTTSGQSLTTPEKNITLPRSTTLSGQSHDGESETRTATVSRSASAAAKVASSKSDTIKSTTSSSAASSREHPNVTLARTKSLASPNRTSGSKGGGDEVKKEKKSKFRTPSFLRKRKEKKEAAHKEKADK